VVTSLMSAIVQAIPNASANSEETASRPTVEAMVAELTAQVAQLSERVARGLDRLDALRSTDAHRIDREITSRTEQRKDLAKQ
jgi:DNA-binding ferritin-like protein